ncbi:MAG: substrate-binding domain-containing protein [Oscillospiraceae bacterium]|nr:substrate-binding domain-containing protein [Oscillospiraceae bacterium]
MKKAILLITLLLALSLAVMACGGDTTPAPATTAPANTPPATTAPATTPPATTPPATTAPAETAPAETEPEPVEPAVTGPISVVTREDGSGTRGAFVEIVDITIEGNDNITMEAEVAPGTSVMLTSVAENPRAIGYASTGVSLADDRVRVLPIDGVEPTTENMLSGAYPIARPFLIGYNTEEGLSELAQDFVDFILSAQGQGVVSDRGYVPVIPTGAPDYAGSGLTGSIVINGSSSLYSLMQRLSEAYREINPGVTIDIHGAGTGHGISAVRDGLADIAMSSRDLRDSELEFMTPLDIAIDGIAVIVNPSNDIAGLTMDEVRDIFLGEVTTWEHAR